MGKNTDFDSDMSAKLKLESGKVYVNTKQVALVHCVGEYTHITLANGNDHKFKTEQLVILGQ